MLNPKLNRQELAHQFAADGRVRIANLLDTEIAERIRKCCLNEIPYEYLTHVDGRNITITADEMANMNVSEQQELQSKILAAASKGIGFFYSGYMMRRAQKDTDNENMKFMHSIFDYLNSDAMLSFICEITGRNDLKSADAQYTQYTPGQFLTRHRDDVTNEERQIAYVESSGSREARPREVQEISKRGCS